MVDWNDLKAYEAIARAGSLTGAAHHSDMSIATLSRRLDSLERNVGIKLAIRSSSGIELTQNGRALFEATHLAQNAIDEAMRLGVALKSGEADLPVRVSATETVITTFLAPKLPAPSDDHKLPPVDFIVTTDNTNLAKKDADIAIRLAKPTQDTLITRRIATVKTSLFASPSYLEANPFDRESLNGHRFIIYNDQFGDIPETIWARKQGFYERAVMFSSSTLAMLEAVVAGSGIGLLPDYLAHKHNLVSIDYSTPPPRTLWLVFHRDTQADKRIKAVRDWIAETIRSSVNTRQQGI